MSDVDLILLANKILKELLPNKKIKLYINSLGYKKTLATYKKELENYFRNNYKQSTKGMSKLQ